MSLIQYQFNKDNRFVRLKKGHGGELKAISTGMWGIQKNRLFYLNDTVFGYSGLGSSVIAKDTNFFKFKGKWNNARIIAKVRIGSKQYKTLYRICSN